MAAQRQRSAHRCLRVLFDGGTLVGLTDGQLMERFATRGGESAERAFAAPVNGVFPSF